MGMEDLEELWEGKEYNKIYCLKIFKSIKKSKLFQVSVPR